MGDDPSQLLRVLRKEIASFLGGRHLTSSLIMIIMIGTLAKKSRLKRKRRIYVVKLVDFYYRLPKLYSLSVTHCSVS